MLPHAPLSSHVRVDDRSLPAMSPWWAPGSRGVMRSLSDLLHGSRPGACRNPSLTRGCTIPISLRASATRLSSTSGSRPTILTLRYPMIRKRALRHYSVRVVSSLECEYAVRVRLSLLSVSHRLCPGALSLVVTGCSAYGAGSDYREHGE